MNDVVKKIVGIERGLNKKYNTPYTVLHTQCAFDEYFVTNRGAVGNKVETTYIRDIVNCNVGDSCTFIYQRGFNGEAVVSDVLLVTSGK